MTHRSGQIDLPAALRRLALAVWTGASALPAHAFFLEGEALDAVANALALIVIVAVPVAGIVLFWMVHVLPEKIAHRRQHPQRDAIRMLCLLSLVFGGVLWPLAWLWAYSKPVLYKLAYGSDTLEHGDAPAAPAEAPARPSTVRTTLPPALAAGGTEADAGGIPAEIERLRGSVDRMLAHGGAPPELAAIRDQLAALERRPKATPQELPRVEELH